MTNREELDAARAAALACASAVGWLIQIANGKAELSPAVKRDLEQLLANERWNSDQPLEQMSFTPFLLRAAVRELCDALTSAWGVISKVEKDLTRAALGPVTSGGMTKSSAHQLAWAVARHLWALIRMLDVNMAPELKEPVVDASRFHLDDELVRTNLDNIIMILVGHPPFDAGRVRALIEHESVRAIDVLELARDEAYPKGLPAVFNPLQMKQQLEQDEIEFARTERLPAPETLTVGEMIEIVTVVDRISEMLGSHPVIGIQWSRRTDVLKKSLAFQEFMEVEGHRISSRNAD